MPEKGPTAQGSLKINMNSADLPAGADWRAMGAAQKPAFAIWPPSNAAAAR